jgi:predicted permease
MKQWVKLRSWLRAMWQRPRLESEMDSELHFHIQACAEDLERAGMPREEAMRQAKIQFGGLERVKEEGREARGLGFFDGLLQDLRYAVRVLRKSPGFTVVAIITLALGIGANTAIFSLINAVMLRSLPVPDPQQLVMLRYAARRDPDVNGGYFWGGCMEKREDSASAHVGCSFSHPMYEQIHAQQTVLSGVSAFIGSQDLHMAANGHRSDVVSGNFVSGDFFSTLRLKAELGRTLEPSDDTPVAAPVAVLGYGYWRSEFGADPSVVGKSVSLEGVVVTIVGVVARGFTGLDPSSSVELWLPLSCQPQMLPGRFRWNIANTVWAEMVGRLKPGVTKAQAESALTAIFAPSVTSGPDALFKPEDAPRIELPGSARGLSTLRYLFSTPLFILMAAVSIILLLAVANVSGLLLARAAARRREIAVRLALGARRLRILRQLLTESLLLGFVAAALGILLAYWGVSALAAFFASNWQEHLGVDVHPDPLVLGFTVATAALAAVLFGLAPGLLGTRLDLAESLKGSPKDSAWASRTERRLGRLGSAMVVTQVVLSVVLVVGAGLLLRTLENLETMDVGFNTHNVLLVLVDPNIRDMSDPRIPRLCRELQTRFAALPGVVSASYSMTPLLSERNMFTQFAGPKAGLGSRIGSDELPVGTNFFETMHIPLLAGRTFTAADFQREAKPAPVIVNRRLARLLFGTNDPIGQRFSDFGSKTADYEVIGLVADAKYNDLRRSLQPNAYLPLERGGGAFEIRTAGNPRGLIPAVRAAVAEVNHDAVITQIETQLEQIDHTLYQERLFATLSGLFGLLALVLSCIGLYGLLAYEVTRRTHEIGVRMAIGAAQGDVLRLVLERGLLLAAVGVGIGLAAAAGLTRYLESLLYGIRPVDWPTYLGVAILLLLVALLACWIPARRATRVDPMIALRYE